MKIFGGGETPPLEQQLIYILLFKASAYGAQGENCYALCIIRC